MSLAVVESTRRLPPSPPVGRVHRAALTSTMNGAPLTHTCTLTKPSVLHCSHSRHNGHRTRTARGCCTTALAFQSEADFAALEESAATWAAAERRIRACLLGKCGAARLPPSVVIQVKSVAAEVGATRAKAKRPTQGCSARHRPTEPSSRPAGGREKRDRIKDERRKCLRLEFNS
jgi:hypothetical protein